MLTLKHPEILVHLRGMQYGYQPCKLRSGERLLVIKHRKEAILAASLQRGFRIYCVPDYDDGVLGLITAVFDDADEPITLMTPLFTQEPLGTDILAALQQSSFELYFFDELDRELIGVRVADPAVAAWAEALSRRRFRRLDVSEVPSIQRSMTNWFAHRTAADDQIAVHIPFSENLYLNDFVFLDARNTHFDFIAAGSEPIASLVREEPGPFQERDIFNCMLRLFPPEAIFLNPFRTDAPIEFADVVVSHVDALLIFQAKDSPNTPEILARALKRKRTAVEKHLAKAV